MPFQPIWTAIFSEVSGMTGAMRVATVRIPSNRLYITRSRRGRLASSLASVQGVVSSIYLLQCEMSSQISLRAAANLYSSMRAWVLVVVSAMRVKSGRSCSGLQDLSAFACEGVQLSHLRDGWLHETVPEKYFSVMAVVRETRLPRSLARSRLRRFRNCSAENLPSSP